MSKRAKVLTLLVFITAFFCITFNITKTYAAPSDDKKANLGAYNELDKQFRERIKALKGVFGSNSIDEVALAATILYSETSFSAVGSRYIDGSDWKDDYELSWERMTKKQESNSGEKVTINKQSGVSNDSLDLLTAAAIIMADSAGWNGSYNEDKFKEALAGDTFIANNPIADAALCTFAETANSVTNLFNFQSDENTDGTWYNRERICNNGYVGGIYNITKETEPDPEIRKAKKEEIAKQIIDFIHYYKLLTGSDGDNCIVTTTGDFANWKQYDPQWKNVPVGNSGDNIGSIGCLATSVAIQMARSGTAITNMSNGFNPGTFVEVLNKNGGFDSGGSFQWGGHESIASNWKYGNSVPANVSSTSALAKKLSEELSTPAEGKYQKFIVLQTSSNKYPEHWVAVDSVTDSQVTIFDPAEQGNTLDANYSSWTVMTYKVMYATDVEQGKTGSSSASGGNSCGGSLEDLMTFINNFEGGTTCNNGTGYTTSTLPNDPGGLTASNGVTLGTAKGYAEAAGFSPSEIESEYRSGCPNKEKMDKVKMAILQSMYEEVGNSAAEKGVTLSPIEHLALTSVRYGGYGMDRAILDKIKAHGNDSYEVFHCFVSLGCGFGNGSYMDGLANRRAGEYELFRSGNLYVKNVGKGYAYYQAITNKAELEHYMKTDWPTGEAPK